ncbi:Acyl-CoA synthetase (AMP-forming)/AMP-acid ligase II [Desulfocicer vacuolatum DSM 3385]|uniref:Acyl-CoA synthetase (AMP-forming)/AMP-acid ligase II n=1 Tax=Desulfocicer vacuolatum DSM 3385 TaxID=1121400 RepID=A0A1W2A474_9BACT|nr:AMP-binding protein [Desulfocicer vacuolatum]SMC55475.1 Acyl-CoA synthetase (AMP-forming)/AMP-acid ligase II [Desulfocicer vacuolatum DSM 3385]
MIITEILARNSRLYKNDIALIERVPQENIRREITWNDFYRDANRMGNALVKKGIKKGDAIVQLMTNSLEWLPIYFGILNTGAWAVPLNFRFEADKIRLCTEVSEAKVFIFGEEFIERLEGIRVLLEATVHTWIFTGPMELCPDYAIPYTTFIKSANPDTPPRVSISIEDDAALYFTSGTTGTPKAVLLTHRNLEHACYIENNHHKQTREDVFLCIPPLYHTGAKMHWFGSFLVGGKAIILKGVRPEWILEAVSEERATIVWLLVPWAYDILTSFERNLIEFSEYHLAQWRLMHIGAQPVPPSLIKEWKEYFPGHCYDTNYGLTESTGPGCVHLGMDNDHKVGAIGRAGFDWEARIVDGSGNLLPPGESGELIVRGPGVMKCYYKNPQATADTIKEGWLHTGDIARRDKDGFIFLVDRKKDVIICGGENIFPVEIEHFFMQNKKIQDIGVIGIPDERLGEIPAGIIAIKPDMELTKHEVKNFGMGLPRYKRLKKIIFAEVPRNATGKIEKPKLRRLYAKDARKDINKLIR